MKKLTEKDYKVLLLNQLIHEMLDNRIKTSGGFSGVSLKIPKGFEKTPKEVIKILEKYIIIKEYSNTNHIPIYDNGKGTISVYFRRIYGDRKPFSLKKFFQLYERTLEQIEEGRTV